MLNFLILFAVQVASAAEFTDMVLVNSREPFYIEIFEVRADEATRLMPEIKYNRNGFPARMTFQQAKRVCELKGMRLPTKEQWIMAASNLGANKVYSLPGDTLQRSDGSIAVNIATGDSISPYNIQKVGMDAIGTVGMTGNRSEYYLNADGTYGLCGGEYGTGAIEHVQLSRICEFSSDERSTARCVVPATSAVTIRLTGYAPAMLRERAAGSTPVAPATPSVPGVPAYTPQRQTLDDILIEPEPLPSEDSESRLRPNR